MQLCSSNQYFMCFDNLITVSVPIFFPCCLLNCHGLHEKVFYQSAVLPVPYIPLNSSHWRSCCSICSSALLGKSLSRLSTLMGFFSFWNRNSEPVLRPLHCERPCVTRIAKKFLRPCQRAASRQSGAWNLIFHTNAFLIRGDSLLAEPWRLSRGNKVRTVEVV